MYEPILTLCAVARAARQTKQLLQVPWYVACCAYYLQRRRLVGVLEGTQSSSTVVCCLWLDAGKTYIVCLFITAGKNSV